MPPLSPASLFGPKAQGSALRSSSFPGASGSPSGESELGDANALTTALVALAEIGEHTVMLVHKMRSPLSVILNALRLCEQMPLPKIARQRLTLALEEAEQMNRMVDEVMAFARYARFPTFHWSDLEMNALMQEVLQLIAQMPIAQHRQIHLKTSDTLVWVRGDRDKLKQVLMHLLTNVCETLDATSSLHCQIELGADQTHSLLRIGHQLSPPTKSSFAHQDQPHQQFNLSLGLLLVQRLISTHGGTFWIESIACNPVVVIQLPIRPSPFSHNGLEDQ